MKIIIKGLWACNHNPRKVLSIFFCVFGLFSMNIRGKATLITLPVEISEQLGGSSGVTLSAWVKRDAAGLDKKNVIADITVSNLQSKVTFGFSDDNTIFIGARTSPNAAFHSAATTGRWTDDETYHIVASVDLAKKKMKIYVDGVSQEVKVQYPGMEGVFSKQTGARNTLGAGADLGNNFHGELRNIYVYNRVLTQAEVGILHVIGADVDENEIPSLLFYRKGDEPLPDVEAGKKPVEFRDEIPLAVEMKMLEFAGPPAQTGRIWGQITGDEVRKSIRGFLDEVQKRDISQETLKQFAQPSMDRVMEASPHWLDEWRAIAEGAEVDPDTYILYRSTSGLRGRPPRGLGWNVEEWEKEIEHECTTLAATGKGAKNNAVFFHRTQDNVWNPRRGYIKTSSLPGIYKYIQSGSSRINEKGLAVGADWGGPRPQTPRYAGFFDMHGYILERAEDCEEALEMLENFVGKGWFAGGSIGQRTTIVDRHGGILDVTYSSDENSLRSRRMENRHITRGDRGNSRKMLMETEEPLSFLKIRDISRETLVNTSISGMTADIHPEYPEYLTIVWCTMPTRSIPFPLFMGGRKTPRPLIDGTIDDIGRGTAVPLQKLVEIEQKLYEDGQAFREKLYGIIKAGGSEDVPDMIDEWTENHARKLIEKLKSEAD